MRMLFDLRPSVQILISGTVRNAETFGTFTHACGEHIKYTRRSNYRQLIFAPERNHFQMTEIDFQPRPIREQTALFYAKAVPFKIYLIRGPSTETAR